MTALDNAIRDLEAAEYAEEAARERALFTKAEHRKAIEEHKREVREMNRAEGITKDEDMCFGLCVECEHSDWCHYEVDRL